MEEPEVKRRVKAWLQAEGFKVRPEVAPNSDRDVILDFFGYSDGPPPITRWVEAKGDVDLSELLGGFTKARLAVYLQGGLGILAVPNDACRKLLKYKDFLKHFSEAVSIFDVEKGRMVKLVGETLKTS